MAIETRFKRLRWLILAGILVVLAAATAVFLMVGTWLVVQDPLGHADAIVVLSGRLPDRALEAARLYQAGYASQVWISQPVSPAEELKRMDIIYVGEDFYNQKVLLARGVPVDAIRILERPAANTEQEVGIITDALRAMQGYTVIIVSSKPHTRRIRAVWNRRAGSGVQAIIRHSSEDPYDGAHWWRRTRDALDVVRETFGLLNAWAGFPLRPTQY